MSHEEISQQETQREEISQQNYNVNIQWYRAIKWACEGHHNTDTLVYCLNRQTTACVSGSVPFCVSGPGSMVSRCAVQTTAHPWPQLQASVHAHLHCHPATAGKMHKLPLQSPFMATVILQTAYTDFSPQLYFSRSSSSSCACIVYKVCSSTPFYKRIFLPCSTVALPGFFLPWLCNTMYSYIPGVLQAGWWPIYCTTQ